jgi:hypothetical protein
MAMAFERKTCPACREEMVEGFILDVAHAGRLVSRWLKGSPEMSSWMGVKMGVKTKGRECRNITAYRCTKCGLLQSYAIEEVPAPSRWRY